MAVFVYCMVTFRSVDMEVAELLELVDKNPLELFNKIKDVIRDLGVIEHVELYRRFFDP